MNEKSFEWLSGLLRSCGVTTDSWKKTPHALLTEINDGSCTIRNVDGRLVRTVRVAVIYASADGEYFWAARRATKSDGDFTMTEKLHVDEPIVEGSLRGLYEETGITPEETSRPEELPDLHKSESGAFSYPGIVTIYGYHVVVVVVPAARKEEYDHTEPDGKRNVVKLCRFEELGGPHRRFVHAANPIKTYFAGEAT
jgi:hypothetical protein